MKKIYLVLVFALLFGLFALFSKTAFASSYASDELIRSKCANVVGDAIIDVEQEVKNDADSGTAGNFWALDNYQRQIQVWATTTTDAYCAIVKYDGDFVTFAGFSPQHATTLGTVGAGVEGNMEGGYRATFVGTLKSVPSKPVHGNIGTYDYQCNSAGVCPGYESWLSFYFDGVANFDQPWWGWKYTTEHNGTWINQISGNIGDITGIKLDDELEGQNNDNNGNNEE